MHASTQGIMIVAITVDSYHQISIIAVTFCKCSVYPIPFTLATTYHQLVNLVNPHETPTKTPTQ